MALNLKAVLGLDGSGFEVGIKRAQSLSQRFASNLKSAVAGGAITAGLMKASEFIDRLAERAKEIKFGSGQSGFNTEEFQRFDNTLKATNQSTDKALNSLEKLAEVTEKIKNGGDVGGKLAASMATFGVTLDDIKKKDHKQIFFQISEAMRTMTVDAKALNAIQDLLGGKGGDLIPAMKLGFDSRAATQNILSEGDLKELDQLNRFALEAKGPWQAFGNEVALALTKIKVGLLSIPTVAKEIFGQVINPHATEGDGKGNAQSARLVEAQQRKAALQLERQQAAEKQRQADKIKEGFTARQSQLQETIAAERFSQLPAKEKLAVLKAQAAVLRQQQSTLENLKYAEGGEDLTGKFGAALAENELARLKNKAQQKALEDSFQDPDKPKADRPLNLTALQQAGAKVSGAGRDRYSVAIDRNTKGLETLTGKINRMDPNNRNTTPSDGVHFG